MFLSSCDPYRCIHQDTGNAEACCHIKMSQCEIVSQPWTLKILLFFQFYFQLSIILLQFYCFFQQKLCATVDSGSFKNLASSKQYWLQYYSSSHNPRRHHKSWRCSFIYRAFSLKWEKHSTFTPCSIRNISSGVVRLLRHLKWEWKTFQECQWRIKRLKIVTNGRFLFQQLYIVILGQASFKGCRWYLIFSA